MAYDDMLNVEILDIIEELTLEEFDIETDIEFDILEEEGY